MYHQPRIPYTRPLDKIEDIHLDQTGHFVTMLVWRRDEPAEFNWHRVEFTANFDDDPGKFARRIRRFHNLFYASLRRKLPVNWPK